MKSRTPINLPAILPILLLSVLLSAPVRGQQANFTYTATPSSLCAPVTVKFQNTSTGSPIAYSWDLDNGNVAYTANPEASYTQPGTYRVTLTVQYANGSSQYWKEFTINPSPAVDFTVDATTSCKPFNATFTDLRPAPTYAAGTLATAPPLPPTTVPYSTCIPGRVTTA